MTPTKFCIDIDNVLARTDERIRAIIEAETGRRVSLVYEDIVEFDYHLCKDRNGQQITKEEWHHIHDIFSEERHIMELRPMEGAADAISKLLSRGQVLLVTSRMVKAREATSKWLAINGFPKMPIEFANHRRKHEVAAEIDFVIEDDYDQAALFIRHRQISALVIEHPWNKSRPKMQHLLWAPNWEEVIKVLD